MSGREPAPVNRLQSVIGRGQFLPLRLPRSALFTDSEMAQILNEGGLLQPPPRCQHHNLPAAVETPGEGVSMVRNVYDTRTLVPPGASIMYFHPGFDQYLVFNPANIDRTADTPTRRNGDIIERGIKIAGDIWMRIKELGREWMCQESTSEMHNGEIFTTVAVSVTSTSLNPFKFALKRLFNRWFPARWLSSRTDGLLVRFSMVTLLPR